MSSEIIHQFETATTRSERCIAPDNFLSAISYFKKAELVNRVGHDNNTTIIYSLGSVAIKYEYSSGVGSSPNTRESITLYGKREDRNILKSKLLKKLEV